VTVCIAFNLESRRLDTMNRAAVLANWYNGPLRRQGHGQQPKSGNPAHRWHWLQKTDRGWESIPLVAGKAQHFETAQQAIHHAKSQGFEVYDDAPEFKDTFAIIP